MSPVGKGLHINSIDQLPTGWSMESSALKINEDVKHHVIPLFYNDGDMPIYRLLVEKRSAHHPYVTSLKEQLKQKNIKPANDQIYIADSSLFYTFQHSGNSVKDLQAEVIENNQGLKLLKELTAFAFKYDSSDIHCEVETRNGNEKSQIEFRIMGRLVPVERFNLPTPMVDLLVAYIFNLKGEGNSTSNFSPVEQQQCNVTGFEFEPGKSANMRVACAPTYRGYKIVIRLTPANGPSKSKTLPELGYLPDQLEKIELALGNKGGGILIAGVVGSGKSTSTESMIGMAPSHWEIYTVEDPIEREIANATQFQIARNLEEENNTAFLGVKRQLKRMDLDACFIGEIRDRETAAMFRDVIESGHRGWSTIHAGSAYEVVGIRLPSEELGIPRHVIASPNFLNLVIYQALVPKLCECKLHGKGILSEEYLSFIEMNFGINPDQIRVANPEGCPLCRNDDIPDLVGIKGRTVVAEMLEINAVAADFIMQGNNQGLYALFTTNEQRQSYTSPITEGKFAWEVALYHVSQGTFDPRSVEQVFGSLKKKLSDLRR